MPDLTMQDLTMTDQMTGVEMQGLTNTDKITRVENAGADK